MRKGKLRAIATIVCNVHAERRNVVVVVVVMLTGNCNSTPVRMRDTALHDVIAAGERINKTASARVHQDHVSSRRVITSTLSSLYILL